MKNGIFKLLLTIICLLGNLSVYAYDFEVNGIYYDVISQKDHTCKVVSGTYIGDIVIPPTVNYNGMTMIVLEIGEYAFDSELTGITIPNTISTINNYAFNKCSNLERVTIEDGTRILYLGYSEYSAYYAVKGLFYFCPITSLYIGRNLSYTYNTLSSPFSQIETLKDVTISNTVTEISPHAFSYCSNLTSITIPNSVITIGKCAFNECKGLTSITMPNSITNIGEGAFSRCNGLTTITIPNSVITIGEQAFYQCNGLTSITMPNSVITIGEKAFYGCNGLTSITIPDSVTELGDAAFAYCRNLESATISNSVTKLHGVFYGCGNLKSLTLGSSLTLIDAYSFVDCGSLSYIYSLNPTPPSVGAGNFTNYQYMTTNVFVPQEALGAYQSDDSRNVWKNFWNLQGFDPAGIEGVKSDAINGNNVYYDLRGNRLDAPKKGLNIINGKKVLMK